jgi:hypothetical protein
MGARRRSVLRLSASSPAPSVVGEELGSAVKAGSVFATTDTLTIGPGGSPWTRSVLNRSVLLPAPPPMLAASLAPFDAPNDPADTVHPST